MARPDRLTLFFRHVDVDPDGCWLWRGYRNRDGNGYGLFWFDGRLQPAIRFACKMVWGLRDDEEPDHLCRVMACVNPWHLEPVTRRENLRRANSPAGLNARKTHCVRGHLLDGDNLLPAQRRGYPIRVCRACVAISNRERQAYKREWLRRKRRANSIPAD